MASVSIDGQSILIDGRRLWLVSGSLDYSRIPNALWSSRLARAQDLGLNCIEVPVPWSAHEPHKGVFDVEGDRDLVAFIDLIADSDMHCTLRLGPFIGYDWSMGGIPVWAAHACGWKVRHADPQFLSLVASYWRRLGGKLAHHMAAKGGPVVAVQIEHHWMCGDDDPAHAYLGELCRLARESGFNVPMLLANNLFTDQDGAIEAWSGYAGLHAVVRQLATLNPKSPPIVAHLSLGCPDVWGADHRSKKTPAHALRRLIEVASAGGQFNISPLGGSTHTALSSSPTTDPSCGCITTDHSASLPILQCGAKGGSYNMLRRACHFLRSFDRVLAAAEKTTRACVSPETNIAPITDEASGARGKPVHSHPVAVERAGDAGSIVFVLADDTNPSKNKPTNILLCDGTTLEVAFGNMPAAWVLHRVRLDSGDILDYCSLSAFAQCGNTLVCFAPSGTLGSLSINGSAAEIAVPTSGTPSIERLDNTTVVVCNEEQINRVFIRNKSVFLEAEALHADGSPVRAKRATPVICIDPEGEHSEYPTPPRPTKPKPPALPTWSLASGEPFINGTTPRFATIEGPSPLHQIGVHEGYGWYRVAIKNPASANHTVFLPGGGSRATLFANGSQTATLGPGPDATTTAKLSLDKGPSTLTFLVDDTGRGAWGRDLSEPKGISDHLYAAKPLSVATPVLQHAPPISPLDVEFPVMGIDRADTTSPDRPTWTFIHRKKTPVFMEIDDAFGMCVLVVNNEPQAVISGDHAVRIKLDENALKRGSNTVQLAMLGDPKNSIPSAKKHVRFIEGTHAITEKGAWSFAAWETPAADLFAPIALGAKSSSPAVRALRGTPCWWRAEFSVSRTDTPLFIEMTAMSRGVLSLNGHRAGRYWVTTRSGDSVPPQLHYYLPEPWLRTDAPNELVIFDEHGSAPSKVKLVHA